MGNILRKSRAFVLKLEKCKINYIIDQSEKRLELVGMGRIDFFDDSGSGTDLNKFSSADPDPKRFASTDRDLE
uniref:Uncharacterized protein n=1 Tax=Romanomermis culicivorax TaxID=13658 RepID=A0A915HJQ4_ROMCU